MSISHPQFFQAFGVRNKSSAFVISIGLRRTPHRTVACAPRQYCYNAAGGRNPNMLAIRLMGVLALIALNGFFAATEFSLVAVRLSRVRQLVAKGNVRARVVETLLGDLHRVVSGRAAGDHDYKPGHRRARRSHVCEDIPSDLARQLLEPTPRSIPTPIALACAFALLSSLHVVIGELVPKTVSLARAERVALLVALPFHWFLNTFHWAIHLLDRISSAIVTALGVSSAQVHGVAHSTEELQIQIQQARERGLIAPGEEKFILSAMELAQIQVREIMVPRPDIHTLSVEAELDEVMRVFATTQRSRIPVYRGNADHILGFVHIKDMIWILLDRERRLEENLSPPPFDLRRVLREVLIVPETKPASELLLELRTRHVGMALVVDEFGSILGLVTMEDILEQMVGEIHDEFDVVERPLTLADGALIFDAALNVTRSRHAVQHHFA